MLVSKNMHTLSKAELMQINGGSELSEWIVWAIGYAIKTTAEAAADAMSSRAAVPVC